MSDVIWTAAIIILFIAGFACAAYSGWQVFCPMRFRRIYVVYLTSQKLRARGEKYFWYASFVASILECTGIALALQQNSASVMVAAAGGIIAVVGFAADRYYAFMASIVRDEEIAEAVSSSSGA
ncbi:MAG: hypothetical protein ACFNNB_00090 [Candidatus Saccharimonas sp.]